MSDLKTAPLIPTPLDLQFKRVRYQVLPVMIFLVSLSLTAWLWKSYSGTTHGTGEVSLVALHISASHDGKLAGKGSFPRLYDHVEKGQAIGRIDSGGQKVSELTAPASGMITAIKHQPGEFVKSGQEILTLTQDDGAYIVSYVRPGSSFVPRKDMRVSVRGQDHQKWAETRVQEVGSSAVPIPDKQATKARVTEWGIPVRIEMPDVLDLPLRPGETVLVNFRIGDDR